MTGLRSFLAAIAIIAGALLVAAWALSWTLLRVVDDGAVARGIAETALENPAVSAGIADQMQAATERELQRTGVDIEALGLSDALDRLLQAMASSEGFRDALVAQIDANRADLQAELAAPDRPEGPFALSFDVSQEVNERVDTLAIIGETLPEVAIAPVEVEVVSAERFEQARSAYAGMSLARDWFGWAGLGSILLGLLVSPRRQYVLAKFFLTVGVLGLLVFIVLTFVGPLTVAGWLPGGEEGFLGRFILPLVSEEAISGVTSRIGLVALISLGVGGLAWLLGWLVGPRDGR